jgi:cytochrome c biogenesis protein CcdA/peroxiredoxin
LNPENVTLVVAFLAGLISFISPCVLPLVPAYIGYMGGRVTNTVAAQVSGGGQAVISRSRFSILLHGLMFVAGFTFVFVLFGLLTTVFIQGIGSQKTVITGIIGRLGGVMIIFFGLHFMGALRSLFSRALATKPLLRNPLFSVVMAVLGVGLLLWGLTGTLAPSLNGKLLTTAGEQTYIQWTTIVALIAIAAYLLWLGLGGAFTQPERFWTGIITTVQTALYTDTRRQMTASGREGLSSSAIMGVVFAAGWTPCIGPVYGTILTVAAQTGNVNQAVPLLTIYSLGLGVPFLLMTLLLDSAQGLLRRLQRRMHTIELVSGAFLVLIGLLVASNQLQLLSQSLSTQFADVSYNLEESVVNQFVNNATAVPETPAPQPTTAPTGNAASATGLQIGNRAPNFQAVNDKGDTVKLSDYRGKVVILNFWATWCGPCRVEMPEFEKAYQAQADKGFVVLAVNNRETTDKVAAFRSDMALTFPIIMDENGDLQSKYSIQGYPTTYVIDRKGVIVAVQPGPMTAAQVSQLVDRALAS